MSTPAGNSSADLIADHRAMCLLLDRLTEGVAAAERRRGLLHEFLVLANCHRARELRAHMPGQDLDTLQCLHEGMLVFVDQLFCEDLQERVAGVLLEMVVKLMARHAEIEESYLLGAAET